jgi:hypothetical protein
VVSLEPQESSRHRTGPDRIAAIGSGELRCSCSSFNNNKTCKLKDLHFENKMEGLPTQCDPKASQARSLHIRVGWPDGATSELPSGVWRKVLTRVQSPHKKWAQTHRMEIMQETAEDPCQHGTGTEKRPPTERPQPMERARRKVSKL